MICFGWFSKRTKSAGLGETKTSGLTQTLHSEDTKMDKYVKSGFHWTFGWMRRADQDCEYGYAYEHPDGEIIWTGRKDHKIMAYLDCMRDEASGELYVTFSAMNSSRMAMEHPRFKRA
jgi:hypothetical protein